jgi:hypothetical protein
MGEAKRRRELRGGTVIPDDIKADIASVVHGVRVAGLHRAAGAVTLKTSGRSERRVQDERKVQTSVHVGGPDQQKRNENQPILV